MVYEIYLHRTYQQPVLFFTLHDLPVGEQVNDIDSVFRYLVPENRKVELRSVTPLGALSLSVSLVDSVSCCNLTFPSLIPSRTTQLGVFIHARPKKLWSHSIVRLEIS